MDTTGNPADVNALRECLEKIAGIESRMSTQADGLASDIGALAKACSRFEMHVDKQYGVRFHKNSSEYALEIGDPGVA
jgi:hypothetical protein